MDGQTWRHPLPAKRRSVTILAMDEENIDNTKAGEKERQMKGENNEE